MLRPGPLPRAPALIPWLTPALIVGIVLFERGRRVSAHLARVRRVMADGRLVRRVVHGQPYWTSA